MKRYEQNINYQSYFVYVRNKPDPKSEIHQGYDDIYIMLRVSEDGTSGNVAGGEGLSANDRGKL